MIIMVWVGNVPPNAHALKGWSLVSDATFGGSRNIRRWDPAGKRTSWGGRDASYISRNVAVSTMLLSP